MAVSKIHNITDLIFIPIDIPGGPPDGSPTNTTSKTYDISGYKPSGKTFIAAIGLRLNQYALPYSSAHDNIVTKVMSVSQNSISVTNNTTGWSDYHLYGILVYGTK